MGAVETLARRGLRDLESRMRALGEPEFHPSAERVDDVADEVFEVGVPDNGADHMAVPRSREATT